MAQGACGGHAAVAERRRTGPGQEGQGWAATRPLRAAVTRPRKKSCPLRGRGMGALEVSPSRKELARNMWWDDGLCGLDRVTEQPPFRTRCRLTRASVRPRGSQQVAQEGRPGCRFPGSAAGCGAVCLDEGNIEGSCLLQEGTGCYSGKDSGETQEKST